MVVHISPGHTRGTLVNALLGHCNLPPMTVPSGSLHAGGSGLTGATGLDGDEIEGEALPVNRGGQLDQNTSAVLRASWSRGPCC